MAHNQIMDETIKEKAGVLIIHHDTLDGKGFVEMVRCANNRKCEWGQVNHKHGDSWKWDGWWWVKLRDESGNAKWFCPECAEKAQLEQV